MLICQMRNRNSRCFNAFYHAFQSRASSHVVSAPCTMFELQAPYELMGDQPKAVAALCTGLDRKKRFQTLLGATGTGKTFMMANVIKHAQRPTLVLAPNKVLAAQLYNELSAFFPKNAVEYFVSFYDYYLPESYSVASDTYVDKVTQINDDIDRMRHSATKSLLV